MTSSCSYALSSLAMLAALTLASLVGIFFVDNAISALASNDPAFADSMASCDACMGIVHAFIVFIIFCVGLCLKCLKFVAKHIHPHDEEDSARVLLLNSKTSGIQLSAEVV